MLQQLLDGFLLFATLESFIALGLGVFIGVIVGAIPGLTTPMAVALTLPFTFTLSPVTGILLLLGVYKGGIYGGSITAILINAPGTPAAPDRFTVQVAYVPDPFTESMETSKAPVPEL